MKRTFDIIFLIIALLVFSIPIVIIVLFLKLKEKHAIFFKQERIGENKEPFQILKFQTLVDDIPTKTGRILRKTGLDELPQLLNVLKGEMSIVGPRALTQYDINRLEWNDKFHSKRLNVKPGITGPAQLYGGQNKKTSWFWDKKYLTKYHLILDFNIIIVSFLRNIMGKIKVRKMIFFNNKLK